MTVQKIKRTVLDLERLYEHLQSQGYKVEGVAAQGGYLFIDPLPGENRKADAYVASYVDQDYYEFTTDKKCVRNEITGKVYQLQRNGVDVVKITCTKRSGKDGSVKKDTETVDIHWHGGKNLFVSCMKSNMKMEMVDGVGSITAGKVYLPGGALVEAVHPQEQAYRATLLLEYVRVLK